MLIGIAQPLTWPYVHSWTHLSMFAMERPDVLLLDTPRGGDIAEKREAQTLAALKAGCSHIAYLDADMVYPPKALVDMIELDSPLAAVVCYRGAPPHDPLIWGKGDDELLKPFKDYQFGDVVDATAVGCACLLVKREVIEAVRRPWFQVCEIKEGEKIIRRGEDTYFTRKCTSEGFALKVITKYDVGHIREVIIDRDFWLLQMLVRKFGSKEKIIEFLRR